MIDIPLCFKCCEAMLEEVADHSRYILIGCKANPEIGSFSDATRKCPLLTRNEKNVPKIS